MGDMADFELESVATMEGLRDDFVAGDMPMDDAYDHGFIDEMGCERGLQGAWDRSEIGSIDTLNALLEIEQLNIDVSSYRKAVSINEAGVLNAKAIVNLLKPLPTCNVCEGEMVERDGRYGIFYFCPCEGQKTVSKQYWDSVRII